MPTARELLEQADALMRRNRARDSVQKAPVSVRAGADIPLLTDVVETHAPPPPVAKPAAASARAVPDVPVLTEVVEEIEAPPVVADVEQGDPSFWLDGPDEDKSVLGKAPDSVAVVPPPEFAPPPREVIRDARAALPTPAAPTVAAVPPAAAAPEASVTTAEFRLPIPPAVVEDLEITAAPTAAIPSPPARPEIPAAPVEIHVPPVPAAAAPPGVVDEERWQQLAEDVRMQVLQRIDIFTDTGLREQLGERLKPIVDRASADLVATINQHVGELLRTYVAEAIEREIERWRRDGER